MQSRKRETELQNKRIDTKGGGVGGGLRIDTYTLMILCIKHITSEKLLYSRELYSMLSSDLNEQKSKKRRYIYIHIANSLCHTVETDTTLLKQLYSNKINFKNK